MRLTEGPASVSELAAPFTISQPAVSQHLRVLEATGLIVRSGASRQRVCSLRVAQLVTATEWLEHLRSA